MENVFTFQHDAETITKALNISKDLDNRCHEIIFFSTMVNYCISHEMFDDRETAPRNITTLTGDLEKALSLCSNDQEKNYVLFMFRTVHELTTKFISIAELEEKQRKKLNILFNIMELETLGESKAEYSPQEIFRRLKLVRKSNYNFETYLKLINFDSDDLINKAFGNDK
jgi:hypothetical protein